MKVPPGGWGDGTEIHRPQPITKPDMKQTDLRPKDILGLAKHECGLYVKMTNGWTQAHFKHECYQKGDIIYITCRKIIEDNDRSEWARTALEVCFLLLQPEVEQKRKRWPDMLSNDDNDAKNNIVYHLDYLRWKIWYVFNKPKPGHRLYRPQTSLTRDAWIYFFTASALLGEWQNIQYSSIPWYLLINSPTTRKWHRYLKSGSIKDLESYKRSENRGKSNKDYVKLLEHYRRRAVIIKLGG